MPDLHPPPYDSVVTSLEQKLGPKYTTEHFMTVMSSLTPNERAALASNDSPPKLNLDSKQAQIMVDGMNEAAASEEAGPHFEGSAEAATQACVTIDEIFKKLDQDLAVVDSKSDATDDKFSPVLKGLYLVSPASVARLKLTLIYVS